MCLDYVGRSQGGSTLNRLHVDLNVTIGQSRYQVGITHGRSLAIPLNFNGNQANHFGAEKACALPLSAGDFIGDTKQGGSCNVAQIQFTPHCNGTHTETIGHIVNDPVHIADVLSDALMPAYLLSIEPKLGGNTNETYIPNGESGDQLICRTDLSESLDGVENDWFKALIIRTQPNEATKQSCVYSADNQPPFFSNEAMAYLVEQGVEHLLVDFPSVDKMYDQGVMSNHRLFWNVAIGSSQLTPSAKTHKTITEMIYVDNGVSDGRYMVSIQSPAFMSDAAPSRPIIYPISVV